jgi:hypothetical protein
MGENEMRVEKHMIPPFPLLLTFCVFLAILLVLLVWCGYGLCSSRDTKLWKVLAGIGDQKTSWMLCTESSKEPTLCRVELMLQCWRRSRNILAAHLERVTSVCNSQPQDVMIVMEGLVLSSREALYE